MKVPADVTSVACSNTQRQDASLWPSSIYSKTSILHFCGIQLKTAKNPGKCKIWNTFFYGHLAEIIKKCIKLWDSKMWEHKIMVLPYYLAKYHTDPDTTQTCKLDDPSFTIFNFHKNTYTECV